MAGRPGKIAMLGGGSWGTALSAALGELDRSVHVWDGCPEVVEGIERNHRNPLYLTEFELPETVRATPSLAECLSGSELIVVALPAAAVREVMVAGRAALNEDTCTIVSGTKGLEPDSGARMTRVIGDVLGADAVPRLAALSGPNLASELMLRMPTATVVAGEEPARLAEIQRVFNGPCLRVYTSGDIIGVELGGALKNIIAIAAGAIEGLGFADNTKASLITRGLAEITRVGVTLGAQPQTFMGLSGLGDLVATCSSRSSRNWRIGHALAQGATLRDATEALGMVAEGVPTTRAARVLSEQTGVEMPIAEKLHATLFEGKSPREAIEELMTRPLREEA